MWFKKVHFQYNRLENIFVRDGGEISFLVFFRMGIALIALIELASLYMDLPSFFSLSETLIPQELMYLQFGDFMYLHSFYEFLETHGLTGIFYKLSVPTYIIALVCLFLGLFTRYVAGIALILQLIIFRSFGPFNYGYDFFLTMSLFYCLVFPVGHYFSLDAKIFKRSKDVSFNYRRVLQIHLAIAYFFSGIAKGLDVGWWNGNSVWKAITSVDNSFYSFYPVLLTIVGIGTVLLEFSYPFLVYKKGTRKYVITAIILMHASIAMMMGLYAFSAMMIVWNVAAFGNITMMNKTSNVETA
ncbi:MAG: hypothetical protein AAFX55_20655 [Bacteroidota bacterium]